MFNVDLLLDKLFVFEVLLYLPTKSRTNKDIHLTFSYTLFTGKHRFRVERSKPAIVTHQLRSIILLTFVACTHTLYIYTLIILLKVNKILTLAGSHVTPSRAPMQIPSRLLHFIQTPPVSGKCSATECIAQNSCEQILHTRAVRSLLGAGKHCWTRKKNVCCVWMCVWWHNEMMTMCE